VFGVGKVYQPIADEKVHVVAVRHRLAPSRYQSLPRQRRVRGASNRAKQFNHIPSRRFFIVSFRRRRRQSRRQSCIIIIPLRSNRRVDADDARARPSPILTSRDERALNQVRRLSGGCHFCLHDRPVVVIEHDALDTQNGWVETQSLPDARRPRVAPRARRIGRLLVIDGRRWCLAIGTVGGTVVGVTGHVSL
jgi:hypothetical protein